jgi:hypothetical protein
MLTALNCVLSGSLALAAASDQPVVPAAGAAGAPVAEWKFVAYA